MGFGIVEAGNYNPSRSLMNVNLTGIRACVFDAYGTLFDVNSAAERTQDALREKWQQLAEVWRAKQLQYTWLRKLVQFVTFRPMVGMHTLQKLSVSTYSGVTVPAK